MMTKPMNKFRSAGRRNSRNAMAIVLVMMVVALVSVMGYAMLAGSSTRAHMSSYSVRTVSADALAESGVNLAAYYLQNPETAPTYGTSTFWPGANGITFGSSITGSCNVVVTSLPSNVYRITSTGMVPNEDGTTTISRKVSTAVQLSYDYKPRGAVAFNGNVTLPSGVRVNGNVWSNGKVTLSAGSQVTGTVFAQQVVNSALASATSLISTNDKQAVPKTIHNYTTYKWTDGNTYNATRILLTTIAGTTLGPTPLNPGGVYYSSDSVKLAGNVTINGTLYAAEDVELTGTNNTVTANTNMPAIVAGRNMLVNGGSKSLTVNGLVYVTNDFTKSNATPNTGSTITINGALLCKKIGMAWTYGGGLTINYDSAKASAGNFTESTAPSSVSFVSWNDQGN